MRGGIPIIAVSSVLITRDPSVRHLASVALRILNGKEEEEEKE